MSLKFAYLGVSKYHKLSFVKSVKFITWSVNCIFGISWYQKLSFDLENSSGLTVQGLHADCGKNLNCEPWSRIDELCDVYSTFRDNRLIPSLPFSMPPDTQRPRNMHSKDQAIKIVDLDELFYRQNWIPQIKIFDKIDVYTISMLNQNIFSCSKSSSSFIRVRDD